MDPIGVRIPEELRRKLEALQEQHPMLETWAQTVRSVIRRGLTQYDVEVDDGDDR